MTWFIGFLASYLTARTLQWPLIWGVAVVAGLYLLATGGAAGITGVVGSVVSGAIRGVESAVSFVRRFLVGLAVFLLVGVLFNRVTGVDLGFAAPRFKALGAIWGWPSNTDIAVLMYICSMAIAAVIAVQYASGKTRNATIVVVSSFVITFMVTWMPRTVEEIRPKSSTPVVVAPLPKPATKWEDADQALKEEAQDIKRRGLGRPLASVLCWAAIGDWCDKVSSLPAAIPVILPAPASRPSAPAPAPAAPALTETFYPFGADGCYEKYLGYKAQWSPKDGAMRVYNPAGGSHVETLGIKSPTSTFGPGTWRFCAEDPGATGVVIWE